MRYQLPLILLVASSATLLAQAPSTPPMKMGLWQAESTFNSPGTSDGKPIKHIVQSCSTRTNWLTLMGPTAKDACPKTNEAWTSNSYRFDVQCPGKPKMATVEIHFDDPEHQHFALDDFAMPDGKPMNLHVEGESHWVSSDCGKVSPDSPVIVSGQAK